MANSIPPSKVDTSLAALLPPERERLTLYGARLLLTEMEGRLALATRELARFETKYGTTLTGLAETGLPDEADLETHEDYVEWSGWQATVDETSQTLDILRSILEAAHVAPPPG